MPETATRTLTDFLLDRIAEDEGTAHAAQRTAEHQWSPVAIGAATGGRLDARVDEHIARHDPARVLAECEAKRRIVALHEVGESNPSYRGPVWPRATCQRCVGFHADMDCENEVWPCETIRALALPYTDHPDYRDEWRP